MQTAGIQRWTWTLGDRDFYWSFAVRPYQANMSVTLLRIDAVSDNDVNQVTDLFVRAADTSASPGLYPGQLRFTAIKVWMA
jgi:hypothetical protein